MTVSTVISFLQKTSGIQSLVYVSINFVIMVVLMYVCKGYFKDVFKKLSYRDYSFLFIILAAQFLVHFYTVIPKHATYIDEFWYMKAARDMLVTADIEGYPKSIGWPFLIALGFLFFGVNNYVAIFLCMFLGLLIPLGIFLITFLLSGKKFVSFAAAVIFAFLPPKIFWASTAETHIPALFFVTIGMFFSLLYYRERKDSLLWLSLITWAFSAQIRQENVLFFILFLAGIFLFSRPRKDIYFYAPWIVSLNFLLPNMARGLRYLFSYNRVAQQSGGLMQGKNVSLSNLVSNSVQWFPRLFDGSMHSHVFSALALLGFLYFLRYKRKQALFLFFWFFLLYLTYFSMWLQVYGQTDLLFSRTRIFLFFYPVLSILCAYGCSFFYLVFKNNLGRILGVFLFIAVLLRIIPYYDYRVYPLKSPMEALETSIISTMKNYIPHNCIIITNYPSIVTSVNFYRAVSTPDFANNEELRRDVFAYSDCVLFFEDITCFVYREKFAHDIEKIKRDFRLEPSSTFSSRDVQFKFYRVSRE